MNRWSDNRGEVSAEGKVFFRKPGKLTSMMPDNRVIKYLWVEENPNLCQRQLGIGGKKEKEKNRCLHYR